MPAVEHDGGECAKSGVEASRDRSVRLGRKPASDRKHLLGVLAVAVFDGDVGGDRAQCLKHRGNEARAPVLLLEVDVEVGAQRGDGGVAQAVDGDGCKGRGTWVGALCPIRIDSRELLASAGGDGTVRIWDPTTGETIRTLRTHSGSFNPLCVVGVGDRELLVSAANGRRVWLWDPVTGDQARLMTGHIGKIRAICPIRIGARDLVASAGNDRTIRLWEAKTGHVRVVVPIQYRALALAALPEGRLAAASPKDSS